MRWAVALLNQHDEVVATYELLTMNATAEAYSPSLSSGVAVANG